jgi:hypothetical protein
MRDIFPYKRDIFPSKLLTDLTSATEGCLWSTLTFLLHALRLKRESTLYDAILYAEAAVFFFFFSFEEWGGGAQLGPLGTSASNSPIVPDSGDYENGEFDGMMIVRGNRSTRRKPAPVPLCPPQNLHDLTGREPGPPRWEASVYRLSYGTATSEGYNLCRSDGCYNWPHFYKTSKIL